MPQPIDITGQRYGKLVALHQVRKDKHGAWLWAFQCDCGNVTVMQPCRVRRKVAPVMSCGCVQQKLRANFIARRNVNKLTIEDLEDAGW